MEFKAPSGAKVIINPADFKDAMALKSAIAGEIAKSNIDIDLSNLSKDSDVTDIVKLFMILDSSINVYDAVFKCLVRCTHNGEKITELTFDDVNNRQDYYEIMFHCIKENLSPFLGGLRLRLSTFMLSISKVKDEGQK